MKQYVKSSKFETRMCLVNQYGEVICELEHADGSMYYVIPAQKRASILMDEGDVYSVEELEFEVD